MAHALVTGGTGFVGGHVVRALRAAGHDVTCLVRATSRREDLAPLGVRFVEGDATDPTSVATALARAGGVDWVVHLAALLKAPWRPDFVAANAAGAAAVVGACAGRDAPPACVVVSSLAAAGPAPYGRPRDERDLPRPASRYGRAKLAAEEAARALAGRAPVTIVRPPAVLGGGDRTTLPVFRLAARGWVVAPTRRRRPQSFVHAADLAALLLVAAARGERLPAPGEAAWAAPGAGLYFAAADEPLDFVGLGRVVARALGRRRPRVVRLPEAFARLAAAGGELAGRLRDRPSFLNLDKARELAAGAWWCSAAKARTTLGWAHAPLERRLAETAADYRALGLLA